MTSPLRSATSSWRAGEAGSSGAPEPGVAERRRMFVRPGLRGTGLAAGLLAAAEQSARDLGAARMRLDTRLDLVEARALYLRHGYTEVPAFNEGDYAEVWYAKDL